jgi:hypothetical protein
MIDHRHITGKIMSKNIPIAKQLSFSQAELRGEEEAHPARPLSGQDGRGCSVELTHRGD